MSEAPRTGHSSKRTDFREGLDLFPPYDIYRNAVPITEADCKLNPETGLYEHVRGR